jgi:hypothetical protein
MNWLMVRQILFGLRVTALNGFEMKSITHGMPGSNRLHAPHRTNDDIAINKSIAFTERIRFKLQAELINAFNHPLFQYSNTDISSTTGFGRGYYNGSPRNIEFRANIEF